MKKILFAVTLAALLAGCAQLVKVGPGDVVVGERLLVKADGTWNQMPSPPGALPGVVWTVDGTPVDSLVFMVGLKDGTALAPQQKEQRPLLFKAAMQPHELQALFQALLARDGSAVTVDKVEPTQYLGGPATRMEFTVVRKVDDVTVRAVVWASVRNNELHAVSFQAPRIAFFPRHQAKVEEIVRSARLKG